MIEGVSRILFGAICHQDPSILMQINGREVLLCPRCIGLHTGFLFSFIVLTIWNRGRVALARPALWLVVAPAIGAVWVDWLLGGRLGFFTPTTASRLVTGLACGSGLAMLLAAYRADQACRAGTPVSVLSASRAGLVVLASAAAGVSAVLSGSWVFLTSLLVASVAANVFIAAGAAASAWRARRHGAVAEHGSKPVRGGAV